MKTATTILGLVLVALVGCDGSSEQGGFDVNPPGDVRGDAGAGGAAGTSGSGGSDAGVLAAGGASAAAGGRAGAAGAIGSAGGMSGSAGGAGGTGAPGYLPCPSPSAGGNVCERASSINGGTLFGSKEGMLCMLLVNPITGAAAGTSECTVPTSDPNEFLVAVKSCTECTFQ